MASRTVLLIASTSFIWQMAVVEISAEYVARLEEKFVVTVPWDKILGFLYLVNVRASNKARRKIILFSDAFLSIIMVTN